MHVVAPYHSCASHIPCQHKSVWLGRRRVSGQGNDAYIVRTMRACIIALNACTKVELACGGVHPDRTRVHLPVTLVVPPATLAQAHDMAPQYPLHPTLTSMRVRGGSEGRQTQKVGTKICNCSKPYNFPLCTQAHDSGKGEV